MEPKIETIILGGGCFWCLEAIFQRINGVETVESGYSDQTEVVKIRFEPSYLDIKDIYRIFFSTHDPTLASKQKILPKYKSVILYQSQEQKIIAQTIINEFQDSKYFSEQIKTEVLPLVSFTKAKDQNQNYYNNNPKMDYCKNIIGPKIQKISLSFPSNFKTDTNTM